MAAQLEWETGPLGFPATSDWSYWTPQNSDGLWRAWYFPDGLIVEGDLLADDLPTQEEAAAACQKHWDNSQEDESPDQGESGNSEGYPR